MTKFSVFRQFFGFLGDKGGELNISYIHHWKEREICYIWYIKVRPHSKYKNDKK